MLSVKKRDGRIVPFNKEKVYSAVYKCTKQKASLYDLALERFKDDSNLLKEISSYLKSRKQSRNYPTRTAWIEQLNILESLPKIERAQSVHRSTVCGYRSIAYKHEDTVAINKVNKNNINMSRGF